MADELAPKRKPIMMHNEGLALIEKAKRGERVFYVYDSYRPIWHIIQSADELRDIWASVLWVQDGRGLCGKTVARVILGVIRPPDDHLCSECADRQTRASEPS
jgi:hypothetical protein